MKKVGLSVVKGTLKGVISQIPIAGPIMTSIYDEVLSESLLQRRQAWEQAIEERFESLEDENIIEKLKNNDQFVTCLLMATQQAALTEQAEKIAYLSNAVVNSVCTSLSADKIQIFLRLIEKYTLTHIIVLDVLNNPGKYKSIPSPSGIQTASATWFTLLERVYPQLNSSKDDLIFMVYKELYSDGLLNSNDRNAMVVENQVCIRRTTIIGQEFMDFISPSVKE